MNDGLEGYDGDPSHKVRGGRIASPGDLREAGVRTSDSPREAAEKLQRIEQAQYARSQVKLRPGQEPLARMGLFLLVPVVLILVFAGGMRLLTMIGPPKPITQFLAMSSASSQERQLPPAELRRQQEAALAALQAQLGHVFKPGTRLAGMLRHCESKPCVRPDYAAFRAYQRFALHPGSYDSDVCQALVPAQTPGAARLKQEPWVLGARFSTGIRCKLAEPETVMAEYRAARNAAAQQALLSVGAVAAILTGLVLLWRRRRGAPGKGSA